jgi:flavodoxin I
MRKLAIIAALTSGDFVMNGKLFYGTQTGTTQAVADEIHKALSDVVQDCKCIYGTKIDDLQSAAFLVLGGSTWGDGELTDDWADFLPQLDHVDLAGKKVALFGVGDQVGYSYNFVSAMKILYDKVLERGAEVIVTDVSTEGFEYDHSESVVDGKFIGLVLDEVNEPHLSPPRIDQWANKVRAALGAIAV